MTQPFHGLSCRMLRLYTLHSHESLRRCRPQSQSLHTFMVSSIFSGGRHFTWVLLTCMFIFCNLSMELAAHSRNTSPRAPNCSTASLTGEIKKIQKGWATRTGLCAGETSAIVAMPTQVPEDHGKGPSFHRRNPCQTPSGKLHQDSHRNS